MSQMKTTKLDDGTIIEEDDWSIDYYDLNGRLHRNDGPAHALKKYQGEFWYQHGQYHREDGPAIIQETHIGYLRHGKYHRYDGPAIIYTIHGGQEWFINGEKIAVKTNDEFLRLMKLKALW